MNFIQLSGYSVLFNKNTSIENQDVVVSRTNKKKRFFTVLTSILLLVGFLQPFSSAQALEPLQQASVNKVIQAFKQNNRTAISKMISYPLFRQAPLAPINSEGEFLRRYDEIFDQRLLSTITNSNLHTDWDSIGWKGVILNNGIVALDPDGDITEINYHSPREQALVDGFYSRDIASSGAKGRRALHRSVTNYNQAVVELTTKRFHIRVDDVGQGNLRYASWPKDKSLSEAPDIILTNGRLVQNGGRNQHFVFDNGSYSYQLNVNSATARPTGSLEVLKDGQSWIREVATQVISR